MSDVRARIKEIIENAVRFKSVVERQCVGDNADRLVDALLSCSAIAIVKLPEECQPPTDWHDTLLGAWESAMGEPVSAWTARVALPNGEFIQIETARTLAAALLAAANAAEAAQ